MAKDALTAKMKLFCLEYLKDLNATQAAIRAGYSKDTAFSIGWENLRKPVIKNYIDKQLEESMNESKAVLKQRIVGELKGVAFTEEGIDFLRDKDGEIYDIRVTDKLKALDMLGKYVAMFTDNVHHSVDSEAYDKLKELYKQK